MPETKFEEIQRKSARGIKWQGMAEIFMRLLQFMVTIVLARLLMPKDFGLISVALIFTQLAFAIFDLGFSAALVQKKEVQEKHLSTTFVVNIISAVVFALLVFSLSSAIASYFGYRQLKSILRLMTLIFFFYAFSSVPRVLLMRALRFKRLSSLQAISTIVYGAVGISLAWTGWGVWSIVFASLCEQFILTLLLNMFSFWRIKWKFDKSAFKELAGFGGRVLGTRISAYFNNNIPNFVIGKWLGAQQLGYFSVAYQLTEFPVQRISKNILKVMFPAFSKLQDSEEEYNRLLLKVVYYLALIVFPVFIGLILIAPFFVNIFYGVRWQAAIVPIQLLSIMGLIRSYWVINSLVFLSKGRPAVEFKINIFYAVLTVPALIYAIRVDLNTVVMVVVAIMFIFYQIGLYKALKMVHLPYSRFLRTLIIPAFATALFVLFRQFILLPQTGDLLPVWQLILTIGFSAVLYIITVILLDRSIIVKLKGLMRS